MQPGNGTGLFSLQLATIPSREHGYSCYLVVDGVDESLLKTVECKERNEADKRLVGE